MGSESISGIVAQSMGLKSTPTLFSELRLASLWQEFQQANIAVKRLSDIMDAPAVPIALIPSRTADGKGEVQVQGLSFRYSYQHPYPRYNKAA